METSCEIPAGAPSGTSASDDLSYKFQRLRERLRQAIRCGELTGKLPGERILARRFNANPKTLGKALTDLAAEGLLERSIGRGTFVRGASCANPAVSGRWMILCEAHQLSDPLVLELVRLHPDSQVLTSDTSFRPSIINAFSAILDLAPGTPEKLYRDMSVRGVPMVAVGKDCCLFRHHCVQLDRPMAAATLTREMFLAGHRNILVVEDPGQTTVSHACRTTLERYGQGSVETCGVDEVPLITDHSPIAILCDGIAAAMRIHRMALEHPHLAFASLAAVGICAGQPPCTGVYIDPASLAAAAVNLLAEAPAHRPVALWLDGAFADRGTIHVIPQQNHALSA